MSASPESLIQSIGDLPRYLHVRWATAETAPLRYAPPAALGLGMAIIGAVGLLTSIRHGLDPHLHSVHPHPGERGHSADYTLAAHTTELRDGPSPSPTSNPEPPVIPWNFPNTEPKPKFSAVLEPPSTSELPSHTTLPTPTITTLSPSPSPIETSASTAPLPTLTGSPSSTPDIYGSADRDEGLGITGALCVPATLLAVALGGAALLVRRSSQRAAVADYDPSFFTWDDEANKTDNEPFRPSL